MDTSTITDYKVSLSRLKILTKGQSWYNSKGYKSENYETEIIRNLAFITKQIGDLGKILVRGVNTDRDDELHQNSVDYLKSRNSIYNSYPRTGLIQNIVDANVEKIKNNEEILRGITEKYDQLRMETLEIFETIIVKTEDMTIQQFFIEINTGLNPFTYTVPQINWIFRVVNIYIRPYLQYDINLILQIVPDNGLGKNKRYKSKKDKDKSKKDKDKKHTRKSKKHIHL